VNPHGRPEPDHWTTVLVLEILDLVCHLYGPYLGARAHEAFAIIEEELITKPWRLPDLQLRLPLKPGETARANR
jgi:hypothetical protein